MPHREVNGANWNIQDFTTFFAKDSAVAKLLAQPTARHFLDDQFSFKSSQISGRGLLCWCFGRQALSLSIRTNVSNPDFKKYLISPHGNESTWTAHTGSKKLSELIYGLTLKHRDTPRGVIAFFGETGSRKSSLARALVDIYLRQCVVAAAEVMTGDNKSEARRPHLLTFEDPIEVVFGPSAGDKTKTITAAKQLQQTANKLGIDYTPRQIREDLDCLSLNEGLQNAKRQKPSVVYVGEVRNPKEWRDVLEFAGSGHLVVTTSHGGSLLESMSTVLKAARAQTPAQRSFVAGRILSIIHVRRYRHGEFSEIVPSLWRRTPAGANTLVTDGLGSIIPHNPPTDTPEESSLGRHWFVAQLCSNKPEYEEFYRRSLLDDLQGL